MELLSMIRPAFYLTAAVAAFAVASVAPRPTPARAQAQPAAADRSPHELRQENERLRERIAQLEAEVAESRRRIARLEEALREQQAAPGQRPDAPAGSDPTAPQTGDGDGAGLPDDPFAAPDAMLAALRREYDAALGGLPRATEPEVQALIREARRWVRQVTLERRRPINWTVRVIALGDARGARAGEAVVEVVEPATGKAIGSPFALKLDSRTLMRVRDAELPSLWSFEGVFAAAPIVDETRAEAGLFNVPQLVGPFVAFGYELSVRTALPAQSGDMPAER